MTITLPIPGELANIVTAITVSDEGTIVVHYAHPISVGAVMADGRTFLGGPAIGPFEIRIDRTLIIEVNRRAKRLGRLEAAANLLEANRRGQPALPSPSQVSRERLALPAVQGYRDTRPPAPAPERIVNSIAEVLDLPAGDDSEQRFKLLELDLPAVEAPPDLCGSCGEGGGAHLRNCNRCTTCGAFDGDACDCP